MEQQFCTPAYEIHDYLAYDPILIAVISLEVTTAGLGATEREQSVGQDLQE